MHHAGRLCRGAHGNRQMKHPNPSNSAMDFLIRIASLVRKELLAVLRDKKSRLALIIPPIIQIAIFVCAATMNVTRVPYAVLDKDGGEAAAQYIADLEGTGIFPAPGRRGHGKRH